MIKKLILTICFCSIASMVWSQSELTGKRTYNQKVYDLGNGKKNYKIHIAHIHYKEGNEFKNIDTRLSFDNTNKKWKHNKASYIPEIPEYADEWFSFRTQYEGNDFTILAKPVADHVLGEYYEDNDGTYVLYPNAFGTNIDLKSYSYWSGIKKVIILNQAPVDTSEDLTFDFQLSLPPETNVKDFLSGIEWDLSKTIDFKGKKITLSDTNGIVYFKSAWIWDSGIFPDNVSQPVDIELYKKGNKIFLRKTITADILQNATYPLYTDHPTAYFSGAGDGRVYPPKDTWFTVRNATTGTVDGGADTAPIQGENQTGTSNHCWLTRSFFPVDTQGIDDGDTISSATFYLASSDTGGDNSETVYPADMSLVSTTQVDPTTLAGDDFNNMNTTRWSDTDVDLGTWIAGSDGEYFSWTLNLTGRNGIVKDGWTKLGIRSANDYSNDTEPVLRSYGFGYFSNETGTSKDPYLDVTSSAAVTRRIWMIN